MKKDETLFCDFCGKAQHEVRKLIAGPMVFICNECTDLCFDIVHVNETAQPPQSPPVSSTQALYLAMALNDAIKALSKTFVALQQYRDKLPDETPSEPGIVVGFGDPEKKEQP